MPQPRTLLLLVLMTLTACAGSSQVSKRDPGDPRKRAAELQVQLGQGYMEQGKFETAHDKLKRAIDLDPSSIDAHTVIAILYERIKRPQLSEKHYKQAVELDPEVGSTNNNFGAYLCRVGRSDEADAYFKKAVEDPFYATPQTAYSNAGVCAASAGKQDLSETYFRKAIEADPRDANSLFELSLISFRNQDYMRARAFIQRFEAVAQPAASALDLAAQSEDRLGDRGAASRYRERLKTEFPDYESESASVGGKSS
jgi:type IV pilus assembly protein PilF